MKKKVKLILHHDVDQDISTTRSFSIWNIIKSIGFGLINFIISLSYYIGLALISIPKISKLFKNSKTKISRANITKFKFEFSKDQIKKALNFTVLISVALTPVLILLIASEGQKVGGRILGISDTALQEISSAEQAIKNQDFILAQSSFANAVSNLQSAQQELDQSSIFLQSVVNFAPDSYNTANALEAAQLLAEAAQIGSKLLQQTNQFGFSPEGLTVKDGQKPQQALQNLLGDIVLVDSKLTKANQLLAPLDSGALPAKFQSPLKDTQGLVADLSNQMSALRLTADLFTRLLLGDKRFLVVLQNNNELRPTGGFIGTIAQGRITDASIKKLDIRSVYDLDGQMNNWITPPYPIRAVNTRWYLRDANWLADFSETAQRLTVMYEQEGGETPDLVLAMTPDLFLDLLNKTGPIYLPRYGVTVSSSNFVEQIQTTTSVAYDKNLNQPKQLLADLYPALLQKISQDGSGILGLIELMQSNLAKKNILVYARESSLQQTLQKFRWAGKISDSDKDYLHINSANLGGTKTDRSLSRMAKLQTTIQTDGSIINQISYSVSNPLPKTEGLQNRSFVRFLVPSGSRLLAADGFDLLEMPELNQNQKYIGDPVIDLWNNSMQFNKDRNIFSGSENNKQLFGGWLTVAGGDTKLVTITYQLPFKIHNLDTYSLLWEKQSGMMPFEISQEITFQKRRSLWDNLGNNSREVSQTADVGKNWKLPQFTTDQFIGLVLTVDK